MKLIAYAIAILLAAAAMAFPIAGTTVVVVWTARFMGVDL